MRQSIFFVYIHPRIKPLWKWSAPQKLDGLNPNRSLEIVKSVVKFVTNWKWVIYEIIFLMAVIRNLKMRKTVRGVKRNVRKQNIEKSLFCSDIQRVVRWHSAGQRQNEMLQRLTFALHSRLVWTVFEWWMLH